MNGELKRRIARIERIVQAGRLRTSYEKDIVYTAVDGDSGLRVGAKA